MSINVKSNSTVYHLAEASDLTSAVVAGEFFTTCTSTAVDSPLEVTYTLPAGYKFLAVAQIKTDGFVSHFYAEVVNETTRKIKIWGNTVAGKRVYVTVLFIRSS